jgi:hypothetical protein
MNDLALERPGLMPFRLLLDEGIRQARRHFRAIYPSVAIPVAVIGVAVAVAQALWYSRAAADLSALRSPFGSPEVLLLTLVYAALLAVAYSAMQVAAVDAIAGRPIDMRRAWRFTLQGRVLGTLFLWYAATLLSVLCCCLPALYVVPLLAFVPPVMVDEGRFGLQAFSRSAELVRHNPGRELFEHPMVKVFLLILVGVILSYMVGLLVSLPFQIPMYVDIFRKAVAGEDPTQALATWMWLQVPAQLLNVLASTAVYLYLCFGTALLFSDTRARKEGSDLRSEIDVVFPPPAPPPELPL